MKTQNLTDVLSDELKDIYNAENQILKALPKMAKAADGGCAMPSSSTCSRRRRTPSASSKSARS